MSIAISRRASALAAGGAALILSTTGWAVGSEPEKFIEVTVTNLTRGQQFTPILVASHRAGIALFELGSPASLGLQTVAAEGNVAPLTAELLAHSWSGDRLTPLCITTRLPKATREYPQRHLPRSIP